MLIGTDREESRALESLAITLTKPFQFFTPTLLTTPIDTLAKSIIANTILNTGLDNSKTHIVYNDKIFDQSKLYDEFITNKN